MKTLNLFNAVLAKDTKSQLFISDQGFIIESNAVWAKKEILDYYTRERLNGNDLNKTFHKSWEKIKTSSRYELYVEQIQHYMSTYGTDMQGEIYIPEEVLELPDVKLSYKVIRALTKKEMTNKCLSLLKSGMALKEETINDVISILVDTLDYTFTGKEGIRNKEAIVKIADDYGVYPEDPTEFFRYIIYRTTSQTLLIKNNELIQEIVNSSYNPTTAFKKFGLEKLATIFNRFKPLFLAYKNKSGKTINRISKLSKTLHKPLTSNPLNLVTQNRLTEKETKWLDNATPYALFKAISACHTRIHGQDTFSYRIRNGKSFTKVKESNPTYDVVLHNYDAIIEYMKDRFDLSDKKIFIPKDVEYALPTSEKMFVGNIPTGTKFTGKKLAAGIYWENSWGASDLDLSGLNIGGKIGWNSSYNQGNGNLMYSGDITNAPNGAVEYLYANNGLNAPTLVMNNVYSGDNNCDYKIIIGKGSKITNKYMMNPDKLFAEVKCQSIQKQTILGMFIPNGDSQSFVLLNFGAGQSRVSGSGKYTDEATKALFQQWFSPANFNKLVQTLGAEIVENVEDANVDLSLDNLERDTFTKLFQEQTVEIV